MEIKRGKKGVSPIISTVLLVMIVIVLAGIIIMWSKGFIKEVISKEIAGEEKEINQVCSEITASAIINTDGSYGVSNNGNIPIYAISLKIIEEDGSSNLIRLGPEKASVNPGQSVMVEEGGYDNYGEFAGVKLIPVVVGTAQSGEKKEFTCSEKDSIVIK